MIYNFLRRKSAKHLLIRSIFICHQLFWKFNPGRCDFINGFLTVTSRRSFTRNGEIHLSILHRFTSGHHQTNYFLKDSIEFFQKTLQTFSEYFYCCWHQGRFYKYPCNGKPSGHTIVPPALLAIEGKCSYSTNSSKTTRYSIKLWPNC